MYANSTSTSLNDERQYAIIGCSWRQEDVPIVIGQIKTEQCLHDYSRADVDGYSAQAVLHILALVRYSQHDTHDDHQPRSYFID